MEVLRDPHWFQGRYWLQAELGRGQLGVVYLAAVLKPRREHVAVKRITAPHAAGVDQSAAILREARAARAAHAPYVGRLLSFEIFGDDPYLVTEYVPGVTLAAALAGGPLPAGTVRVLGAALATALTHLHHGSLVHRDLKPANILLTADGPVVIDFGIARLAAGTRHDLAGTPGYMAPEQYETYDVGPPCDVFALGAVLAHGLTGRPPFGDGDDVDKQQRARRGGYDRTGLPESWRELIADCLNPRPGGRPDAYQVLQRLDVQDLPDRLQRPWLPSRVEQAVTGRAGQSAALLTHAGWSGPPNGAGRLVPPTATMPAPAPAPVPMPMPPSRRGGAIAALAAAVVAAVALA